MITYLNEEKAKIKAELDKIMNMLNTILKEANSLKGEIRIKETTVKKLKQNLKDIRAMLEVSHEDQSPAGVSLDAMIEENTFESYSVDTVNKHVQTDAIKPSVIIQEVKVEAPVSPISYARSGSPTRKNFITNSYTIAKIKAQETIKLDVKKKTSKPKEVTKEKKSTSKIRRSSVLNQYKSI